MPALRLPSGLTPGSFLSDYWQRRPLLMRQALDVSAPGLSADELAGLACEDWVESRIVSHRDKHWQLQEGPFDADHFATLPERDWTLLVNDVEKHLPTMAAWFAPFDFLPRWRFDDLMVSFATAGGSVGPHWDDYDVFLIQVSGHRRWSIQPGPFTEDDLLADSDLRVLAQFHPTESWRLAPGDILYLPPGVGHWGVAEEDCVSYSVGFRAPTQSELFEALVEAALDSADRPQQRFSDAGRALQPDSSANLGRTDCQSLLHMARVPWGVNDSQAEAAIAALLTQTKPHWPPPEPPSPPLSVHDFGHHWAQSGALTLWPYSRALLLPQAGNGLGLHINGQAFEAPLAASDCLAILIEQNPLPARWLPALDSESLALLARLFNQGLLVWCNV